MSETVAPLEHSHSPEAIRERIAGSTQHSYLGDFVLGAVDGSVTTFAVVAGAAGAQLSGKVALVLGLANLVADGLSMAAGAYLGAKSDREMIERVRRIEERHIDLAPDGEREEVRQIFLSKGFRGDLLDRIVQGVVGDRKLWVDTMVTEEFGLPLETPDPLRAAATTYFAFVLVGALPLLPLAALGVASERAIFGASAALTAAAFAGVGAVKGWVTHRPIARAMAETILIGGGAAAMAYAVGRLCRGLLT